VNMLCPCHQLDEFMSIFSKSTLHLCHLRQPVMLLLLLLMMMMMTMTLALLHNIHKGIRRVQKSANVNLVLGPDLQKILGKILNLA